MNNKLLLSAITIVILLLNANISAQDNYQQEQQYGDNLENNQITIQNGEFAIISDTIKNGSQEEVPMDSYSGPVYYLLI